MMYEISEVEGFKDLLLVSYDVFKDERGSIFSSFDTDLIEIFSKKKDLDLNFTHNKFTRSEYNVLRGIHGDNKTYKLVQCLEGDIFQVVVDLNPKSKNYKKHFSINLSGKDNLALLIPPNFGNAFYTKSNNSLYNYTLSYRGDYADAENQFTVKWNSPDLNIDWPCDNPILQQRDK